MFVMCDAVVKKSYTKRNVFCVFKVVYPVIACHHYAKIQWNLLKEVNKINDKNLMVVVNAARRPQYSKISWWLLLIHDWQWQRNDNNTQVLRKSTRMQSLDPQRRACLFVLCVCIDINHRAVCVLYIFFVQPVFRWVI